MSLILDVTGLDDDALLAALRERGALQLRLDAPRRALAERMLEAARAFFARPAGEKAALDIAGSRHFHGYSEMHNQRDWREQLHLGAELAPAPGPEWRRLEGPNLWPDDPAWRATVESYALAIADLGRELLGRLARAWRIDGASQLPAGRDGYRVMKLIGYHPQAADGPPRSGVAAHVDFSWLTLTLQDSAGLEVRTPAGDWLALAPEPGTLSCHVGELLEFAARGALTATPHRVTNPSSQRLRVSIPYFVNPPLDAQVRRVVRASAATARPGGGEHVHRALRVDDGVSGFHFGEAEWRRKGENRWCVECVPG